MSGKKKNKKINKNVGNNAKKGYILPVVTGVIIAALIITLALVSVFSGKASTHTTNGTENNQAADTATNESNKPMFDEEAKKVSESVKVLVEMEDGSEFTLALYPEYAPKTVENFVKLVNEGFYEGVGFHRVVEGFMAQGGDPEGTGMGGSDETIIGECDTLG